MHRRRVCAAFLVAALAGCLGFGGGGSKYYKKGEEAQQAGDLEEAYQHYQSALQAEPTNARYQQAIDDIGKQLAAEHRAEARTKEKAKDWAGASAEWARAVEFAPKEREYQVRRDLSGLKAKSLGPDDWYEAIKGVAEKYQGDAVVARSLEGARAQAYQYNVNLAKQFLASGEGGRAFTYFERARTIDPTTPGLEPDSLARAEALSIAGEANAKLDAGDAVGAYELYQKAYDKVPLPEIKRDLAKVKGKASAILTKLEIARAQAKRRRYGDALRTYGAILDMEGAPPSIEAEASEVRHELIAEMVLDANAKADKKQIRPAHKILLDALTYAKLGRVERDTYKTAIDHARDGRPKTAIEVLDKVGLETTSPLYTSARALTRAAAKEQLANAERTAKKSVEKALAILADLEPFEAELEGIGDLKRRLRSGSFHELLDEALAEAKKGAATESASLLMAALNTSQAPADMRDAAVEGCDALRSGRYGAAEQSFDRALARAPRSKIAQRGVEISRLLRKSGERQALDTIKTGRGEEERAIATLEDAVAVEPNNKSASEATKLLVSRARSASSDAEVAKLLGWAARLLSSGSAKQAIEEGAAKLAGSDHAGAETAFSRAKGNEVSEAGREISRARMLAALSSGAKATTKGDEASAKALAKLLEKDPSNKEAASAVKALLDQARAHASMQEDAEAGRFLGLATIATNPAPGVKKELEKANSALSKGDMVASERGYADALDIEPENKVAAAGYEIARESRIGTLRAGLSGRGEEAAKAIAALLKADPNNKDGKKAFDQLLEEAKNAAKSADDVTAADKIKMASIAANAPDDLSVAIDSGASHLAAARHAEAEKAFVEASGLSRDSRVAKVGLEVARERRLSSEKVAKTAIAKTGDPRPHAKVLQATLLVEPQSKTVSQALSELVERAKKTAKSGADAETAQVLEAAALLENSASEVQIKLTEASGLYAKGSFTEAETAFGTAFGSANGDSGSKIAVLGKELARARRIALLEAEWKSAKADKDVLRENGVVRQILEIDPNHREAKSAVTRVEKEVGSSRIGAAKSNKELGKLGVAYVYLERALALDENDRDAKKEMDDITAKLKDRLDLILLVEPVTRNKDVPGNACLGFDEMLRDEIMSVSSKRTDLGGFVLSSSWTKAVDEKSDKAPEVSGSITVNVTKCKTTPKEGRATFTWSLLVPRKGSPAAKGEATADLPNGLIPRDEQDEAGNNAKQALAGRGTQAFLESLENERDAIDLWLLTLAEHAMAEKDVPLAADAYARLTIKRPRSIDPKRLAAVEDYLSKELR